MPAALARFLKGRGLNCQHVVDLERSDASDIEIWNYATLNSAIVTSKDEDFLYLANRPGAKARLIWIRLGNCRTQALLDVMRERWPQIEARLLEGDRIIEVRSAFQLRAAQPAHGDRHIK